MADVDGAKKRYDDFNSVFSIIIVGSYAISLLMFGFTWTMVKDTGLFMVFVTMVIMIPLVISLIAENYRMRLIFNICIELLKYIDEHHPNVEIPLGGTMKPLGSNPLGKKTG